MKKFLNSVNTSPIIMAALAGAAILIVPTSSQRLLTLVLIWAALAISWNLIGGYAGMLSLGQAAFFGAGAMVPVALHKFLGITPLIGIPIALMLAIFMAAILGAPTFRLKGIYFTLATLAFPLITIPILSWAGLQEISVPFELENSMLYLQFKDMRVYAMLAGVLCALGIWISSGIERSRSGVSLRAISKDEAAAATSGINVWRLKMHIYMISAALAAAAGGLYAQVILVVTPESVFGLKTSVEALLLVMVGGRGFLWGPVLGATLLVPLNELLRAQFGAIIPSLSSLLFGIVLVLTMVLAPRGLWPLITKNRFAQRIRAMRSPRARTDSPSGLLNSRLRRTEHASGKEVLTVTGLGKNFTGLTVINNLSFGVHEGEVLGIVGPNGAGKTTLFNLINGLAVPNAGKIMLYGRDIVGQSPHSICRAGIGRTYQVARAIPALSVVENVEVGSVSVSRSQKEAHQLAIDALEFVGMLDKANDQVDGLTAGENRKLEIARAISAAPKILLLDETLAGLSSDEVRDVTELIEKCKASGLTIVVIEHTMSAMLRVADRFVVLDHGAMIASGEPREVLRDPKVISAYLGKKWSADA